MLFNVMSVVLYENTFLLNQWLNYLIKLYKGILV